MSAETTSRARMSHLEPKYTPCVNRHDSITIDRCAFCGVDASGEASNPLDSVRDLIVKEGAGIFNNAKLGQIDDLLREAGGDVYSKMGPLLGEVCSTERKAVTVPYSS